MLCTAVWQGDGNTTFFIKIVFYSPEDKLVIVNKRINLFWWIISSHVVCDSKKKAKRFNKCSSKDKFCLMRRTFIMSNIRLEAISVFGFVKQLNSKS